MNTKPTLLLTSPQIPCKKKHITWLYKPCWQANFEGLRMAGWPLYVLLTLMKPLKPQLLRLKSKPKSITFTGESTDGVKKSTFSGFKSRCKTPGHSGGSHTNVYNLSKQSGGFESLPLPKKRNLFHTKRKESAPGPPNNFEEPRLIFKLSTLTLQVVFGVLFEHLLSLSSLVHF